MSALRPTVYSPAAGGSLGSAFYESLVVKPNAASPLSFSLPAPGRYRVLGRRIGGGEEVAVSPPVLDVRSAGGRFAIAVDR